MPETSSWWTLICGEELGFLTFMYTFSTPEKYIRQSLKANKGLDSWVYLKAAVY